MLLQIPVKPYTIKFLYRHIGRNYKLRCDDAIGNHLFLLLKKNKKRATCDDFLSAYTCTFSVCVPQDKVTGQGVREPTSLCIIHFNNFCERLFKQEFHTFVETWTDEMQITTAQAIRRFCKRYNLSEEDISEETLRRSYLRYCNKRRVPGQVEKIF